MTNDTPTARDVSVRDRTVGSLLAAAEARRADAPALLAPEQEPLSYRDLGALMERIRDRLAAGGIRPGDPVALMTENGPHAAAAFCAVASCAAAAPLNPRYRRRELEFFLEDLSPHVLLVQAGLETEARAVAADRGIPVLELQPGGRAGEFELEGALEDRTDERTLAADAEDVALYLHTSGTTSRPKRVPLLHRNLAASAVNIAGSLALGPADRCLNVMPLFHIHGLMAAILASLGAGASVVATPGFLAPRFFSWLREFEPSWYTAVPTMHQAVLARAGRHPDVLETVRLRFLRSSSASLPPAVLLELEGVFQAPFVEAYGMTEAAHQMASNPLPPATRKPGAVGPAAGPEVRVMNAGGELLEPGRVGEVVVRGENITPGYCGAPGINDVAFTDGWFRTGDQGYLDDDGYLTLTGRLKELINRAGEKISPREVDEVLLEHPAVRQAVAFSLPHPTLGEEVGALVIVEDGHEVDARTLREHAAGVLADYKVPARVVFADEIPMGPTGKLQRIGLAERLGLTSGSIAVAPEPPATVGRVPAEGPPPLFLMAGPGVEPDRFRALASALGPERALCCLPTSPGRSGTVEQMADVALSVLRTIQAAGPYTLVGHGAGGLIAFQLCHRLLDAGEEISGLVMLEAEAPRSVLVPNERWLYRLARLAGPLRGAPPALPSRSKPPGPLPISIAVVVGRDWRLPSWVPDLRIRWSDLSGPAVSFHRIPGSPDQLLVEPAVAALAKSLQRVLGSPGARQPGAGQGGRVAAP